MAPQKYTSPVLVSPETVLTPQKTCIVVRTHLLLYMLEESSEVVCGGGFGQVQLLLKTYKALSNLHFSFPPPTSLFSKHPSQTAKSPTLDPLLPPRKSNGPGNSNSVFFSDQPGSPAKGPGCLAARAFERGWERKQGAGVQSQGRRRDWQRSFGRKKMHR